MDLWQTTGHTAAIYQDKLHELRDQMSGRRILQSFGVIFGPSHVVIYVAPRTGSDASPQHGQEPFADRRRASAVDVWAEEFRGKMPGPIKAMIDEIASRSGAKDHREAIKQRLKAIRELFRLTRYRRTQGGSVETDDEGGGTPRGVMAVAVMAVAVVPVAAPRRGHPGRRCMTGRSVSISAMTRWQ